MLLLMAACFGPTPTALDVDAAIRPYCEADTVSITTDLQLAVFEGPPPKLAVNVVLDGKHRLDPERFSRQPTGKPSVDVPHVLVDGEVTPQADIRDKLAEKAATARELADRSGDPRFAFTGEMLLQIDVGVPASQILHVLRAAADVGFREIRFIGRSATTVSLPPPADPALNARLAAVEQTRVEGRVLSKNAIRDEVTARCPAYEDLLEAVRNRPHETRCDDIIDALNDLLPVCGEAAVRSLVTLYQQHPTGEQYNLTVLPKRLDPSAAPFLTTSEETWATLLPRLQATGPAIAL